SIGSIYYTNLLVDQLKIRERQQVELFAKALEYTLNNESENLLFVTDEIIFKNNSIPTIWITREKEYQYRNITVNPSWSEKRKNQYLQDLVEEMKSLYDPIQMTYRNDSGEIETIAEKLKITVMSIIKIHFSLPNLLHIPTFNFRSSPSLPLLLTWPLIIPKLPNKIAYG
ncbi:MAG: hypothetical protein MUC73_14410, partial [Cyclobacteriaceae bacterium]|nr:hypothetical protein [Cyclobacteriaceae bacterium]